MVTALYLIAVALILIAATIMVLGFFALREWIVWCEQQIGFNAFKKHRKVKKDWWK